MGFGPAMAFNTLGNWEERSMVKLIIGSNATGKSFYIKNNDEFLQYVKMDIHDYQIRAHEEYNASEFISFQEKFKILYEANEKIKNDIVEAVKAGKDVVVEHTLFKMKRRLPIIEAIRAVSDTPIEIYLMQPSDEQLLKNCQMKDKENRHLFESIKNQMKEIEIPSASEGFSKTFFIKDGLVLEYTSEVDKDVLDKARKELFEEQEKLRKEEEERIAFEKAVEATKTRPFWHICGCGKKVLMTSKEAFEQGWDYPGADGLYKDYSNYGFGTLMPRTCGNCGIQTSVYWKVMQGEELSEKDKEEILRVKHEPMSILE